MEKVRKLDSFYFINNLFFHIVILPLSHDSIKRMDHFFDEPSLHEKYFDSPRKKLLI